MKKPIIATNIDGLLIKHKAFVEPHKAIWKKLIEKTGNKDLTKWIGRKDYFIGVNLAMDAIMPQSSREEKTLQVRKWYQEAVLNYVKENPNCVFRSRVKELKKLKQKYTLALITTNSEDYITKILEAGKLREVYDIVLASKTAQEPKKQELVEEFIRTYGKPAYYLTGKPEKEIEEKFNELEIKVLTPKEIKSIPRD